MLALLDRRENRRRENIDSVDRDFDWKVHVLRNRNGFSVLPRGRDEPLAGRPEKRSSRRVQRDWMQC
jgi:hypothetical protein